MNTKRLILACVVVFVFVFGFEWVFHGVLLQETYAQTASLWRPESEMQQHFAWLVLGQLLLSVMFCVIYAVRHGANGGVGQGIGYGVLVALLLTSPTLISYAVQPLPISLIGSWVVGRIIQLVIAGAILGAVYRPTPQASAPTPASPAAA